MSFETIRLERQDRVAVLTLDRPARMNAINGVMSRELHQAWTEIKRDPGINVAVVTGAGDKALSTGFDVADIAGGAADFGVRGEEGKLSSVRLTALQNQCWKPVVTAVNGMACAGGLHFVADGDIVIAAEHATFFDPHVRVGLIAGLEPIGLARRMPFEPVMRMALLAGDDRMNARRAKQLGLVSEVVPREGLLARALEIAELVSRNSPAAIAATKRALWQSMNLGMRDALGLGERIIAEHRGHPDPAEGARAFREKRTPEWAPLSLETKP